MSMDTTYGTPSWDVGSPSSDYNSTSWNYDSAGNPEGTADYSGTPDHDSSSSSYSMDTGARAEVGSHASDYGYGSSGYLHGTHTSHSSHAHSHHVSHPIYDAKWDADHTPRAEVGARSEDTIASAAAPDVEVHESHHGFFGALFNIFEVVINVVLGGGSSNPAPASEEKDGACPHGNLPNCPPPVVHPPEHRGPW